MSQRVVVTGSYRACVNADQARKLIENEQNAKKSHRVEEKGRRKKKLKIHEVIRYVSIVNKRNLHQARRTRNAS